MHLHASWKKDYGSNHCAAVLQAVTLYKFLGLLIWLPERAGYDRLNANKSSKPAYASTGNSTTSETSQQVAV